MITIMIIVTWKSILTRVDSLTTSTAAAATRHLEHTFREEHTEEEEEEEKEEVIFTFFLYESQWERKLSETSSALCFHSQNSYSTIECRSKFNISLFVVANCQIHCWNLCICDDKSRSEHISSLSLTRSIDVSLLQYCVHFIFIHIVTGIFTQCTFY